MPRPYAKGHISGHDYAIFNTEAGALLDSLSSGSADVIFLDPPFNIGKQYEIPGFLDKDDPDVYLGWLKSVVRRCFDKLSDGGALYLYHLPSIAYQIAQTMSERLEFRHWIAVSMKNNFARKGRLYPAHYALLYFTKGPPKSFHRPRTQLRKCRHCGGLIKDYGGYLNIIEDNGGVNLSDVWDDLSPVRHASTKTRVPNELPGELFGRVTAISGLAGGTYVDPFMGSGGGVVAALSAHMKVVAGDVSVESCKIATSRVRGIEGGVHDGRHRRGATRKAALHRANH
jgi:site-specific DNA-methyltransferase (adenine-specific)